VGIVQETARWPETTHSWRNTPSARKFDSVVFKAWFLVRFSQPLGVSGYHAFLRILDNLTDMESAIRPNFRVY